MMDAVRTRTRDDRGPTPQQQGCTPRLNEGREVLDDTLGRGAGLTEQTPYEEVRDFFHFVDNYIHDLTRWNSDPAHSDGTHNDGIEIQGGQNIYIAGNNVVGSVVAGDGLGPYGLHGGSALIVVQNVTPVQNLVIEGNWFDDAQNSVCINQGKFPSVNVTLQDNSFGRNQFDFGNGSRYPIRISTLR